MNQEQWFKLFDENIGKCKWFFYKYGYGMNYEVLMMARTHKDEMTMLSILNDIWFRLPDHIFNIIEMPEGWREFLDILEIDRDYAVDTH